MAINSISAFSPAVQAAKPAAPASAARAQSADEYTEVLAKQSDQSRPAQPSRQQIDQAMEQMRDALPPVARNLQFSLDEETGQRIIKVVDSTTNEVVRQIPSEELLSIAKALDNFTGLLLKQKV